MLYFRFPFDLNHRFILIMKNSVKLNLNDILNVYIHFKVLYFNQLTLRIYLYIYFLILN